MPVNVLIPYGLQADLKLVDGTEGTRSCLWMEEVTGPPGTM